jgi:hypothetical protein
MTDWEGVRWMWVELPASHHLPACCICIAPPSQKLLTNKLSVAIKMKAEKTKYMLLSHHQNAGQNRDMKM